MRAHGYYINSVALYKPLNADAIARSIHRPGFPGLLYTLSSETRLQVQLISLIDRLASRLHTSLEYIRLGSLHLPIIADFCISGLFDPILDSISSVQTNYYYWRIVALRKISNLSVLNFLTSQLTLEVHAHHHQLICSPSGEDNSPFTKT